MLPTIQHPPSPRPESPWSFRWQRRSIQTGRRSQTIDLAFLFDPMNGRSQRPTSNRCPTRSTAVPNPMLRVMPFPVRTGDDPGSAKPIMAGFISRDSSCEADATAKSSSFRLAALVEQWQEETLGQISGSKFKSFHGNFHGNSPSGNPFDDNRSTHQIPFFDQVPSRKRRTARPALQRPMGLWGLSTKPNNVPATTSVNKPYQRPNARPR